MATYNIAQRPLELLGGYQQCAQFDIDFSETPLEASDVLQFGIIEAEAMITGCLIEVLVAGTGLADIGTATTPAGLFDDIDLSATVVTRSVGAILDSRTQAESVLQLVPAGAETAGKIRIYVEYNKTELVDKP
jgi:hypothetical protein